MASTCRNLVIDKFIKTDATHLLWLDEDLQLTNDNFNKLLETLKNNENKIIVGVREYEYIKDCRLKNKAFNSGELLDDRYCYACFILIPRKLLELETEDWFPEFFNGRWGWEDVAFGFKAIHRFGFEVCSTNAKVQVMSDDRFIKSTSGFDSLSARNGDKQKKIDGYKNYQKYRHYIKRIKFPKSEK